MPLNDLQKASLRDYLVLKSNIVDPDTGDIVDWGSLGASVATDPIWDAPGDLAVGSGADTAAKLSIGSANGMVLQRASGAVAWGYHPFIGAKAYNSATQTMNGSGSNSGNTILTFDSEEYDTSSIHDTGSNTSRLTLPITGYWEIGFNVWGQPPATGVFIDLYVNGALSTKHGVRAMWGSAPTASLSFNHSWIGNFTTTNFVELQLNNPSASAFTVGHASAQVVQTAFWATFLGA